MLRREDVDVDDALAGIFSWVAIETPSHRPEQIGRLLDLVEAEIADLPIARRRIAGRDGRGDHLVLVYDPAGRGGKAALAMGHVDTVWEVGTRATRPIRTEGDRVHGPGIYDMKAGSYSTWPSAPSGSWRAGASSRRGP